MTLGTSALMALTTGNDNTSTTYSGVISGSGGLTKTGSGNFILSNANTYTGQTTVNDGTLTVNGSIVTSSLTVVNSGGTLGGTGTVGNTIINGGALAPGNSIGTINVQGNLVFGTAASYLVEVSSNQSDLTIVQGTAFLGGTVNATFSPGSYLARSYTIVTALGGRNGTFGALTTSGLPAGFTASLGYTGADAVINLTAVLGQPTDLPNGRLSANQLAVANSLNTFFNNGGTLTPAFGSIFGLTGANLANALTQLSGEVETGARRVTFEMTNEFLSLMLDPFVLGRGGHGAIGAPSGALAFAPEESSALPFDITPEASYAGENGLPQQWPRKAVPEHQPLWTSWGAGFGSYDSVKGDVAGVGSHDLTASDYNVAAGMDYHATPDTAVGFALAGGGTRWSLSQGLGRGTSDTAQAGLYASTRVGSAYLAAAISIANHWMSTDRTVLTADHLTANFDAQNAGARVEAGDRIGTSYFGVTPYAAGQVQAFHAPNYAESDIAVGGLGLSYDAQTATDIRSEVGARFDALARLSGDASLVLRARAAWAHDRINNPSLIAAFQALPGATFSVVGATPASNSALASAGAELHLTSSFSLAAKFDGQFAKDEQAYSGSGSVRYVW